MKRSQILFKIFLGLILAGTLFSCNENDSDAINDSADMEESLVLKSAHEYGYLDELIAEIQKLVEDGVLNKGNGNALISKIENALRSIERENWNSFNGQLNSFSNQVDGFISSGVLTEEFGQELIDLANGIVPNSPPGGMVLKSPDSASANIGIDTSLMWYTVSDPDGDIVSYDVYFGTDAGSMTMVSENQADTSYTPALSAGTTYFWKILASDPDGAVSESTTWKFTTVPQNSSPQPFLPVSPAHEAIDVPVSISLQWQPAVDPDGDPVIYHVYFGMEEGSLILSTPGISSTSYYPGTLTANTTYFWKVIASDGKGGSYESPIWNFTTQNITIPTVNTVEITDIKATSAVARGEIVDYGGASPTNITKGLCWSTSENPDINDNHTTIFWTLPFSSTLCVLPNTIYYVRAYVTNSAGTGYGDQLTFTSSELLISHSAGPDFVDSRDGKTYKTVVIGGQTWMAENLAYEIPGKEVQDNTAWYYSTDAWCYWGNDKATYGSTYGILYQPEAAIAACPDGWHVPSDEEWKTLEIYIGMTPCDANEYGWRGTDEGGKLKETGTDHWASPNTGAADEFGFKAIPGGLRFTDGIFSTGGFFGGQCYFWTSTKMGYKYGYRQVTYNNSKILRSMGGALNNGASVRCIKD